MFHRHNYLKLHRKLCEKQWWAGGTTLNLDIVAVSSIVVLQYVLCNACETSWFDVTHTILQKEENKHNLADLARRAYCFYINLLHNFFLLY